MHRRGTSGYLTSDDGSDYETASEEGGGGGSVNGGSPATPEGQRSLSPSPSPCRPQRSCSLNSSSKCVCSNAAQAEAEFGCCAYAAVFLGGWRNSVPSSEEVNCWLPPRIEHHAVKHSAAWVDDMVEGQLSWSDGTSLAASLLDTCWILLCLLRDTCRRL